MAIAKNPPLIDGQVAPTVSGLIIRIEMFTRPSRTMPVPSPLIRVQEMLKSRMILRNSLIYEAPSPPPLREFESTLCRLASGHFALGGPRIEGENRVWVETIHQEAVVA